jgi:transposase
VTAPSVAPHPTAVIEQPPTVVVGIDTHSDVQVAVAVEALGRRLGQLSIPTTREGSQQLEAWAASFGNIEGFGIEGTGSWGANLTRFLLSRGHHVLEVNRPDRSTRRRRGKTDPIDAEAAARAVLAGTVTSIPKAGNGHVEMMRSLHLARRSAQKARRQAANQLHALVVTAPDALRDQLRGLSVAKLVATAMTWRPAAASTTTSVSKLALRSLARRYQHLDAEIAELDRHLIRLINQTAPQLLALKGLGPHTSATLLIAAGDNPERLRSESAFAHLCGAAPVPASSGKTVRYRLNRGGDRQANYALYILAVTRMAWDPATRAYVTRRTTEGKTKKEIIRCLKRHIAREIYKLLTSPPYPTAAC